MLPALLAALIFAENTALGANDGYFGACAALGQICVTIVVILTTRPDLGFWRMTWPVFALTLAMLGWLAAPPVLGGALDLPGFRDAYRAWIAPDLFASGLTRSFGVAAWLLAATGVGYRRGGVLATAGWLVAFGGLHLALALGLREYDPEHVWGLSKGIVFSRFTGTMLNANASACLFGVVALLATGRAQVAVRDLAGGTPFAGRQAIAIGSVLVAIGTLGACAITGSRTSLALSLAGVVALLARDRMLHRWARRARTTWAIAAGAAALLLVIFLFGGATFDRIAFLGQDSAMRFAIWSRYVAIAAHVPLFGFGPLSFSMLNLNMLGNPHDAKLLWYVNSPHNAILSVVLTHGWPFLLLLAAAGGLMIATVRRHRRKRDDPMPAALIAALLLILVCSMVDIALDVPAVQACFVLLVGLLWGRAVRAGRDRYSASGSTIESAGRAA